MTYILFLGIVQPMTPIVPVNHRNRRQTVFSQTDIKCCVGSVSETRPCSTSCDGPRSCEWTEWSEWCGCTRCRFQQHFMPMFIECPTNHLYFYSKYTVECCLQAGKEIRRRFCDHQDSTRGPTLKNPSCYCVGAGTEERECILGRVCDSLRSSIGGTASALGYLDQHSTNQHLSYEPFDPTQEGEEVRIQELCLNLPKYVDNYRVHHLDRKDSALSSTTSSYLVCRWSKWSEWSSCDNVEKRHRNRLCIGNDGK
ncbi:hypothetical protein ANCCAN_09874, partial [Ancylostoma caninum]